MRTGLIGAASVSLVMLSACTSQSYPSADEFSTMASQGDLYSCLSPDGRAIAVFIGQIDDAIDLPGGKVFHVQIIPVFPGGLPLVGHAPFVAESFAYCLPDPALHQVDGIEFNAEIFHDGLQIWQRENGGVFTVDVTEI